MRKRITKGCAQGPCCRPILWNIQYDTVLNLQFTDHSRVVAFADDLILMIRADSISEAENIANVEMGRKITTWAENNKTTFNEEKSQVMLMTIRKRKEQIEILVYINNKAIPQVQKLKYNNI